MPIQLPALPAADNVADDDLFLVRDTSATRDEKLTGALLRDYNLNSETLSSPAAVEDADLFIFRDVSADTNNKLSLLELKAQVQQTSPTSMVNLGLAVSAAAGVLTIALVQASGSAATTAAPVKVSMRSATATAGLYNQRSITGALSLTVASGATLGTVTTVAANLWIYAIDNAGVIELGVSQTLFPEGIYSSTATPANANNIIYSTVARSSVPMRPIGKFTAIQTAGAWASPTALAVATDSVLSDNDPIIASYTSTETGGITTTNKFMYWDVKIADSKNIIVQGSGGLQPVYTDTSRFVCPKKGYYKVSFNLLATSPAANGGILFNTSVFKNGVAITGTLMTGIQYGATATQVSVVNPGITLPFAAGDAISIGISINSGSGWVMVAGGRTAMSIEYMGPSA